MKKLWIILIIAVFSVSQNLYSQDWFLSDLPVVPGHAPDISDVFVESKDHHLSQTSVEGYYSCVSQSRWEAVSHERVKAVGTFNDYNVESAYAFLDEVDWNFTIKLDPEYSYLADEGGNIRAELTPCRDSLSGTDYAFSPYLPIRDLRQRCDELKQYAAGIVGGIGILGCIFDPTSCIHVLLAELEPMLSCTNWAGDWGWLTDRPESVLNGQKVGIYGVHCKDGGHDGSNEMHPFDAIWWGGLEKNYNESFGEFNYYKYYFGAFQDNSNRFNENWSNPPREITFSFPFFLTLTEIELQSNAERLFIVTNNAEGIINKYDPQNHVQKCKIVFNHNSLDKYVTINFLTQSGIINPKIEIDGKWNENKICGRITFDVKIEDCKYLVGQIIAGDYPFYSGKTFDLKSIQCIIANDKDIEPESPIDELKIKVYSDLVLIDSIEGNVNPEVNKGKLIINKHYSFDLCLQAKIYEVDSDKETLLGGLFINDKNINLCGPEFIKGINEDASISTIAWLYQIDYGTNYCNIPDFGTENVVRIYPDYDDGSFHNRYFWDKNILHDLKGFQDINYTLASRETFEGDIWDHYEGTLFIDEVISSEINPNNNLNISMIYAENEIVLNKENSQFNNLIYAYNNTGSPKPFVTQGETIDNITKIGKPNVSSSLNKFQIYQTQIGIYKYKYLAQRDNSRVMVRRWEVPLHFFVNLNKASQKTVLFINVCWDFGRKKSNGDERTLEVCAKYPSKFAVPIAREQT